MTSTVSSLPPAPPSSSLMNGISNICSISSSSISDHKNNNLLQPPLSRNAKASSPSSISSPSSSSMNGPLAINGGSTSQKPRSPLHDSHSIQESDSEAETVVLSRSRARSRSNRPSNHDNDHDDDDDDDEEEVDLKRKPNGDSKRPDRDNDDNAYSSDLSSAPSSRAPSSKRLAAKDLSRKRTASPSRLTHSPPRRKIPKIHQEDLLSEKRRSLKRKARDPSLERGRVGNPIKTEDDSPRGVRIKSSPPMSPPPVPANNGGATTSSTKQHSKGSTKDSTTTNNATATTPLSRPGHSRKRSVPHAEPSSARKTPSAAGSTGSASRVKTKRPGRPPALHFHDHSDNETAATAPESTSSSRSNSPHNSVTTGRRRRPSLSGPAASPARLIGPAHKMKRDKIGRNQLHKICTKGGLDEAKACLEAEPDLLNDADNAGYLPIHAAALAGHNDIVEWLIDQGALVDKPAEDLSTPLLDAVENMHVHVVNTLLEHGADPRHRNRRGRSSIDLASTIRQQSDDPDDEVKMGLIEDALRAALVKMRNKKRADDEARKKVNAAESSSSRAASVASPSHFSPPPQSNLLAGSSSSSRRRMGRGEPTRNEFLWLDAGKGGQAKLKQASQDGDMEMAGKLLESGIIPDPESMMLAASGGHLDVLNLLVAFGGDCDPDPKDVIKQHTKDKSQFTLIPGEETPLLATIGRNNIEVLKLLLRGESMKEPRRLDSKGRSYPDIARQRAGENWEEEVKMLQAAWDAAGGPQKSKRSAREKATATDSSSPVASRKDLKEKERKKEAAKAEEAKKAKRLSRRRSASPAASSAVDDTAASEREISPAIARSKLKDLNDKQKRKERTAESDYDSNATADGAKTKKRRLVLGKDLASKTEKSTKDEKMKDEKPLKKKSEEKKSEEMDIDYPPKREKERKKREKPAPAEEEDVEMQDAPTKPRKKLADPEKHAKREQSIDKRQREGSSSSSRPLVADHTNNASDADKADVLVKKRRKMEDDGDAAPKTKSLKEKEKEEKQTETPEPRKSKEERLHERETRRLEAAKLKASKAEKATPSVDVAGRDTEESTVERKREEKKKKRREEQLKAEAKETKDKEAKDGDSSTKRSKERDTTASDIEKKKSRQERDRSVKEEKKEKEKDAMDIDSEAPAKRRKHSGDANTTADETPAKSKKRKSNGASPVPSASASASTSDDKNGTRHLSDLSNGKSNRGSSIREVVKAKPEPNDDDQMLTEEQRKRQEAAAAKKLEEKRREEEQKLEQERIAENIRLQKIREEEARKRLENMRLLETKLVGDAAVVLAQAHDQAQALQANDKARFDDLYRISRLPLIYRDALLAKDKEEFAMAIWEDFNRLLPLYCVQPGEQQEHWVSNTQASLILGCPHDLDLTTCANVERRAVTATEKQALKQNFHALYSYNSPSTFDFDVNLESQRQEAEQSKFLELGNVFWLKASDLCRILYSDERYRPIVDTYMQNGHLPCVTLWVEDE
ncbi:hypothetical protein ABW20_dc0110234 [Dactylellina cionopaga]|nr:hypothetical protein ABW20_dc0110234 [Dactylellina cionopaga]